MSFHLVLSLTFIHLAIHISDATFCDDTKCNGTGIETPEGYVSQCWGIGPGTGFPFACKEGYEVQQFSPPILFENEFAYFTCCSKEEEVSNAPETALQCVDTECIDRYLNDCWADPTVEEFRCGSERFKYPRRSGLGGYVVVDDTPVWFEHYACCNMNFGEEAPDVNSFAPEGCVYDACSSFSMTGIGRGTDCWADGPMEPMTCDSDVYKNPRKTGRMGLQDSFYWSHYMCCDTDDGTPPLQRSIVIAEWFRISFASFGLICTSILVASIMSSRYVCSHSYNLYLIGLAIPDGVLNCFELLGGAFSVAGGMATTIKRGENFVFTFYTVANIWLNTIVAYQVYKLLLHSKERRRVSPPSKRTVLLQTSVVFLLSIILAVVNVIIRQSGLFEWDGDAHDAQVTILNTTWYCCICAPAFAYIAYVSFRCWHGGLIPFSGRTRQIFFYFFRIVFVFTLFWVPTVILLSTGRTSDTNGRSIYAAHYLASIQATVSFAIAMCKQDVRKAVLRLLSCRCGKDDTTEGSSAFLLFSTFSARSIFMKYRKSTENSSPPSSMLLVSNMNDKKDLAAVHPSHEFKKVGSNLVERRIVFEDEENDGLAEKGDSGATPSEELTSHATDFVNKGKEDENEVRNNAKQDRPEKRLSLFDEDLDEAIWEQFKGLDDDDSCGSNENETEVEKPQKRRSFFVKAADVTVDIAANANDVEVGGVETPLSY